MIAHDIECLDDIGVLERGAHAKLSGNLFVVLFLCFARTAWTELFDRIDYTAVLGLALDKADCAPRARPERSTKFTVLFRNGGMGCVSEGCKWTVGGWVRVRVRVRLADKG